jgi:hypothetical protein
MAEDKPTPNEIESFFHCRSCIQQRPDNLSPREWVHVEVGWTTKGIQVWCVRCEKNIIHLDFEGKKVRVAEAEVASDEDANA